MLDRLGSDALAIDDGCDEVYSGLTARSPAVGWDKGLMSIASEGGWWILDCEDQNAWRRYGEERETDTDIEGLERVRCSACRKGQAGVK